MANKNYFVHESSYIDQPCSIGDGTKIWHFSHIMKNSVIGENCNIGQNVVISPDVVIGNNVKYRTTSRYIPELFAKTMSFLDLHAFSQTS